MGEIADDCFNRAMDELEMLDMDPDYLSGGGYYPFGGSMLAEPFAGKPAPPGSPLARARSAAHAAFDPLWQSGRMTRSRAYSELARRLGIPKHQAHMQMMDIAMCERVVQLFVADDFETLEDDFSDLL